MRRWNGALPSFKTVVATRSKPHADFELVRYTYHTPEGDHQELEWEVTALYATDINDNRI